MEKKDIQTLNLTPDVSWIGVLDFDIVTFDVVMETKFGTTYNSYFIKAEQPCIIETSKEKFWPVYEAKLRSVCDPASIKYIVLDHTEPDHSGNVANLLKIAPQAKVVGSGNAIRYMQDLMNTDFPHIIVKDGDTLDLGNKTLQFISAPNLHWPDSIYTWLKEDQILFTCDSFGAHYCQVEMFDDLVSNYDEAFDYYFDVILKPYSRFLLKAIDKIKTLPIAMIATGHGPILRQNWKRMVDRSAEMAAAYLKFPESKRIFIAYVSAYQKSAMIANALAEGIRMASPDIKVDLQDIEHSSLGEIDEKISHASGILVGGPVINQNILLPVYKLMALINPLRDKGKPAAGFGSYGWSGESSKIMRSAFENLKLKYFEEGFFVKFTPSEKDIENARQFGLRFAKEVMAYQSSE